MEYGRRKVRSEVEMTEFLLSCSSCGRRYDLHSPYWRCPSCKSPLEVKVEYPKVRDFSSLVDRREFSLWRYKGLIPFSKSKVSLGEGLTPLVKHLEGGTELYFKLEYMAPTGSFKDRGAAVGVSRAKGIGAKRIVEDSSGNAGLAYSAYSTSAGIEARIYVPHDAPIAKKELMKSCGARIIECKSREDASNRAVTELGKEDLYVGHLWDPFFLEGVKTEVFELYEFDDGKFDSVIIPVASGTHLLGFYRGLTDLIEMGFIDEMPTLYAVQAGGCTPIYERFHKDKWEGRDGSLADGLRVRNPPRGETVTNIIKMSGGNVVVVDNVEIVESMKRLYRMGLVVEPTSATAYAAYEKLKKDAGTRVLIPLTGTGMKTLDKVRYLM